MSCLVTPHPDLSVEVLNDTAVNEKTALEVWDEGTAVNLNLTLFQDKLHLEVTGEPQLVFLQSEATITYHIRLVKRTCPN